MKVYFGGYNHTVVARWTDHLLRRRYPDDWVMRTPETRLEVFSDKLEDVVNWIFNHTINPIIRLFPDRFKYIRVDHYDTWNLDATLAQVIRPCLEQFANNLHSFPSEEMEDDVLRIVELSERTAYYDTVLYSSEYTKELSFEQWKIILNEMIWAFQHAENDDWQWNPPYMTNDHTFDFDAITAVQERIQNGLQLFAKYYFNLWD